MGSGMALFAAIPAATQAHAEADGPPAPPAALAPAPAGGEVLERALADAGVPDDVRALFRIMAQDDLDPMVLLLLTAMGGQGRVDEGLMFMTALMRGMGGQAGRPTAVANGDQLLVIEDGVIYRIDLAKMAVDGQVAYRPRKDTAAALARLVPLMAAQGGVPEAQPEAEVAQAVEITCVSNLRQLAMGCLMYAREHNGTLMTADWVNEVTRQTQNEALLHCPAVPDDVLGYAMNEKLVGMALEAVADADRVVLLFERDPGDGPAVGGPADMVARHDGNTVVAFADGHVQVLPIDQAMQQLKWDPE